MSLIAVLCACALAAVLVLGVAAFFSSGTKSLDDMYLRRRTLADARAQEEAAAERERAEQQPMEREPAVGPTLFPVQERHAA